MPVHGKVEWFDPATEDWSTYVERLEHYFIANDIATEAKRRSTLLTVAGPEVYSLACNLVAPNKPGDKSYDDLVALIKNHYSPAPSIIVQRYKFHTRVRKQGESAANFVADLRSIAKYCEFGDVLDDMLRDRLVCGINEPKTQKRLLSEPKLTLKTAFELAQAIETASKDLLDIQPSPVAGDVPVHQMLQAATSLCYRCGGQHSPTSCRFKDFQCHHCGKTGHLQKACRKKKGGNKKVQQKGHEEAKALTVVTEEGDSETEFLTMYPVKATSVKPIRVSVMVNGQSLDMELDTGASVSLISESTYYALWNHDNRPTLKPTQVQLKTYTGSVVEVVGVINVEISYDGQNKGVRLHVVKGDGPSLFGRDWLQVIKLNWARVNVVSSQVSAVDKLLDKHAAALFQEGLGVLKGITVKLRVRPGSVPKFHKPRPVPFALKEKVERELERLQSLGVIKPVATSDWAAPIVPVVKKDHTVRVCGDYKLTINQASNTEIYPLPRIEEIFASLAGGKSFTKLDLQNAYQQQMIRVRNW